MQIGRTRNGRVGEDGADSATPCPRRGRSRHQRAGIACRRLASGTRQRISFRRAVSSHPRFVLNTRSRISAESFVAPLCDRADRCLPTTKLLETPHGPKPGKLANMWSSAVWSPRSSPPRRYSALPPTLCTCSNAIVHAHLRPSRGTGRGTCCRTAQ